MPAFAFRHRSRPCFTIFAILAFLAVMAAPARGQGQRLDQERIRQAYSDGDVKAVLAGLQPFQARPAGYPRADSLCFYTYAGIIYYHFQEFRHRDLGEAYLRKLAAMDPAADLRDLQPGQDVLALMDGLKSHGAGIAAGPAQPKPAPAGGTGGSESHFKRNLWIGGAVVGMAAVAGGITWAILASRPDKPKQVYGVTAALAPGAGPQALAAAP